MSTWDFSGYPPGMFAGLLGLGFTPRPISAAGRLLQSLSHAEQAVQTDDDITDELRAALRRADIKARKENDHGNR